MKQRFLPALVTLLTVSAARASDLATTFHFNPDLSREANPIVSVFKADAGTLIASNILATILFLLVPLFFYWRYSAARISPPASSAKEFGCRQLYGRDLETKEIATAFLTGVPFPKNRLQAVRFLGIVLPWSVACGSFLCVFSWWAVHAWHWETWRHLRVLGAVYNYSMIEPVAAVVFGWVVARIYWRMEFRAAMREAG